MVDFGAALGGFVGGLAEGVPQGIQLRQRQEKLELERQDGKLRLLSALTNLSKMPQSMRQLVAPGLIKQLESTYQITFTDAQKALFHKGEDEEFKAAIGLFAKEVVGAPDAESAMKAVAGMPPDKQIEFFSKLSTVKKAQQSLGLEERRTAATEAVAAKKSPTEEAFEAAKKKRLAAGENADDARIGAFQDVREKTATSPDVNAFQAAKIKIHRENPNLTDDEVTLRAMDTIKARIDLPNQITSWFREADEGRDAKFKAELRRKLNQNPEWAAAQESRDVAKAGKIFRDTFNQMAVNGGVKLSEMDEKIAATKRLYPTLPADEAEAVARGLKKVIVDNTGKVLTVDQGKGTAKETEVEPARPMPPAPVPPKTVVEEAEKGLIAGVGPRIADFALRTFGQTGLSFKFQRDVAAGRAMVEAVQGQLFRALAENARMPVGEVDRLKREIDIAPSMWDSKEALMARIQSIDGVLRTRYVESIRASLNPSLPKEERSNQAVRANAIKTFLVQLGNRPRGLSSDAKLIGVTRDGFPVYQTKDGRVMDDLTP